MPSKTTEKPLIRRNGHATIDKYLHEISVYEPLTPDIEITLAQQIHSGSHDALKQLVQSNLRFVVSIAKEYQGHGLPLIDLINEGNLGLLKAATRFDETRGFKFISYAVWWIRQSILQALAEQARIVRLPLNHVATMNKITQNVELLEKQFERTPDHEEIAQSLNLTTNDIKNTIIYNRRHQSLHEPLREGEENYLMEIIQDPTAPAPDFNLIDESLKKEVSDALNSLKERERYVLKMYFGIDQDYSLTLKEIGEEFNLTRERVRQIKDNAIRRLRHKKRSKILRDFLG